MHRRGVAGNGPRFAREARGAAPDGSVTCSRPVAFLLATFDFIRAGAPGAPVRQRDGDRQGQALGHGHHHDGDRKDEECERPGRDLRHREAAVLHAPPERARARLRPPSLSTVAHAAASASGYDSNARPGGAVLVRVRPRRLDTCTPGVGCLLSARPLACPQTSTSGFLAAPDQPQRSVSHAEPEAWHRSARLRGAARGSGATAGPRRMSSTAKQTPPTSRPTLPIAAASRPSASCSGVSCASLATMAMVRPHSLRPPTASTSSRPLPSVTSVRTRARARGRSPRQQRFRGAAAVASGHVQA